ncbi:MAG TPA: hypothetical protein VNK52_04325 [Hyphomicrobiaceae bacterium]|nr:hypothetical protein [Hyphomicrobiaceae bacterium]
MDDKARDKAAPRRADNELAAAREREELEARHADERAWAEARTKAAAALQGYLDSNSNGAHASAARSAIAAISRNGEPRVLGMTWYVWAMLIALATGITLYDWSVGDRLRAQQGSQSAAERERQQIAARCASIPVFSSAFNDFTLIPDTALAGHSKEKFAFPADTTYAQDLNQCAEACRKNDWCKGFDAHFNRCDLYAELNPVANNRCQYWFKRNS